MERRKVLAGMASVTSVSVAGCANQGEAEFEVQDYEIPEKGKVDEPVDIAITFENVGDGDGTLSEQAEIEHSRRVQTNFETVPNINLEIPAGETATWNHSFIAENSGRVSFSYDDIEQVILIEPESKAPRIQRVELITGWESFGDVVDNAIESTTRDSNVGIGVRYEYWHEEGIHDASREVEISKTDGGQFFVLEDQAERLVDYTGWEEWEWHSPFSTDGAPTGEYEATAKIRDDIAKETSEAVSTTFTIER